VHGWLPEVMETPTPVSALLHAGIVNAGGFLVLRFADLVLTAPAAMTAMAAVGAVTALLGALVMLTQTSAKVTLAWSTVAQMGFMMLQLGLGAFALALMHIVGHSLYKAHAFLSAGDALAQVRAGAPSEDVTPGTALAALLASLAVAGLAWAAWGGTIAETPVRFGFALVLAIGLAPFVAAATAARSWPGTAGSLAGAGLVAVAYLALTGAADRAMAGALPAAPDLGTAGTGLLGLVVAGLAGLALLQSTLPGWAHDARARRLRVLVANGFYANALFDRVAGRLGRPLA
jgi:NADH:ubiquinone oxidoreductase subunit 5 (subunit L)/multisubunit Na+/H+ antiporter MnhA subunit